MKMTSAPWVRTWISYVPILPILFTCIPSLIFSNCIRELNYSILETRSHAIEQGVDISTLPNKDLLKGKGETIYYDINVCIDQAGFLTRTLTRVITEDSFYPTAIHTVVYDQTGTHSYHKDGSLVTLVPHEKVLNQDIPGIDFPLTSNQILSYGLNYNFGDIISNFATHFSSIAGTNWKDGTKEFFSSPEFEAIVSPDDYYFLTSTYNHNGELDNIHLRTFLSRGGHNIPEFDVKHTYSDISQGKLQTTTNKVYLKYEILDNGQPVVQYVSAQQDYQEEVLKGAESNMSFSRFAMPKRLMPKVNLFPNPVNQVLNVNFKNQFQTQDVSWSIENINNVKMRKGFKSSKDSNIEISVYDLPSGVYYMHLNADEQTHSQKFIIAK